MHAAPLCRWHKPVLLLAIALVAVLAWLPILDGLSKRYVDEGLKRSATVFTVARTLNAGISFLQSTTITLPVIGGVSVSPGELLDPLSDLVEDFSDVMLFITAAFALQKLVLAMGMSQLLPLILSAIVLGTAFCIWRGTTFPRLLGAALLLCVLARFGVPLAAIGSDLAWRHFMQQDYAASEQALNAANILVGGLRQDLVRPHTEPAAPAAGGSFMDKAKSLWGRATSPVDTARQKFEQIKIEAEAWADHMVRLMVLFLMQAVLIPLALFWLFYRSLRLMLSPQPV